MNLPLKVPHPDPARLVRTNHNSDNDPMIAIDRKLGYVQIPSTCRMEKTFET
jgi:hypothetical protein